MSRKFRVDSSYSALTTYQAHKKSLGMKLAYNLALSRYGWPEYRDQAASVIKAARL